MPWNGKGEYPTLGIQVGKWIQSNCVIPDGERMGDRYKLTHEMWQFLFRFYRIDPDTTKFVHRRGQLVRPQKWGKGPFSSAMICAEAYGPVLFSHWGDDGDPVGRPWATPHIQVTAVSEDQPLALDTPVVTTAGWSTVGELIPGQFVFDHAGFPVAVVRTTNVLLGEPCFAVTFSDGERIVASGSHLWTLERKRLHDGKHESVTLTTAELATCTHDARGGKRCRVAGAAWQLPPVDLPVDPYLFGLWLGDGTTADSSFAIDQRDRDEVEAIVSPLLRDYERIAWGSLAGTNQGRFRIGNMKGHHHRGGRRHAGEVVEPSLRGRLRDIGALDNKHIPELYQWSGTEQRRALLQGLIDSDGHVDAKGRVMFTNANKRLIDDVGVLVSSLGYAWSCRRSENAWRLFFTPGDMHPVARLERKAAKQKPWTFRSTSRYRYVESVESVPSVPVRCIGVDTTDHLFLVGRRCVPTHNTDNVWRALQPMIELGNLAADIPDTGLTRINLPGGGLIEPVTASARSRLGQRITFAVQDETHSWLKSNGGWALADNQRRNLAGMGGRSIETTNAWDPAEQSVAQRTYEAVAPDVLKDISTGPANLSIRNKRERRKLFTEVYRDSAKPPLGWVDLDRIDAEVAELVQLDAAQAERFFGNRIVAAEDSYLSPAAWDECRHPEMTLPPDGEPITLGFDGSLFDDTTGLVGCTLDGHVFVVDVWDPADSGGEVPKTAVDVTVAAAFDRWDVRAMYGDPPYWQEDLGRWYGQYGERVREWWTNRPTPMGHALELFHTSVTTKSITHDGDPRLAAHVGNARRWKDRGHLSVRKKFPQSPDKIDLLVCAVLAVEARGDVMREPEPEEKKPGRLLVF